ARAAPRRREMVDAERVLRGLGLERLVWRGKGARLAIHRRALRRWAVPDRHALVLRRRPRLRGAGAARAARPGAPGRVRSQSSALLRASDAGARAGPP